MEKNIDSRDKLESDIDSMLEEHELYWLRTYIIVWLDRQISITKHECEKHWIEIVSASANCNLELVNKIAELQNKINELV